MAEFRELAVDRPDLLAEEAGILLGFHRVSRRAESEGRGLAAHRCGLTLYGSGRALAQP